MNISKTIDTYLERLFDKEHLDLYSRWAKEYTQRYYECQKLSKENKPQVHSNFPGFESNFHTLLWNVIIEWDPHGEWPYASQIEHSTEHADIHALLNGKTELWFELGMHAYSEKDKYSKDFEKLKVVVKNTKSENIGILIHFEVFEKGNVKKIFEEFAKTPGADMVIDYKEFKDDSRIWACRLIMNKKAEQPRQPDAE